MDPPPAGNGSGMAPEMTTATGGAPTLHDGTEVPPARFSDRVVDVVAGPATAVATGLGSMLRGARLFHPRGRAFHATMTITGDPRFAGTVLGEPGEYAAIARFSRGTGFAEPWPDMLGLAVRLFVGDGIRHDPASGWQDLLLLSSLPGVGVRNLIVFRPGYGSTFYSSIDRLGLGEHTVVVGARARFDGDPEPLPRLTELAAARDRVRFEFVTAPVLGDWSAPIASLGLGDELSRDESRPMRFSPFHRAGAIEPVGPVNTLRRRGYAGSQAGRPH